MDTPKQKKLEEINKFPNWFDCLSPTKPKEESEPDREQVEQLPHHKQPLPSAESSISMRSRHPNSVRMLETTVPCLVKQPGQPELKGVIQKAERARFIVYIPDSDSTITISKLFVYPDFSNSVGQSEKSPSQKLHPSTNNPRKRCAGRGVLETNESTASTELKIIKNPPSTPASAKDARECAPRNRRKKGQGNGSIYYRTVTAKAVFFNLTIGIFVFLSI